MDSQFVNSPSRFADRVLRFLERVEHRRAETDAEKEAIYRLRHDAYMREGAIDPHPSGMFHDAFDEAPNVWIIGTFIDGELASSIRLHVASDEEAPFPANTVFADVLAPHFKQKQVMIDPTRFVTRLEFSKRFPEMPYITVRPGWMAGEFFKADYILATIRSEHQGYYRRVFGHVTWCDSREYPTLKKRIACMGLDYPDAKQRVHGRYPFYQSSSAEREKIFGRPSNSGNEHSAGRISWETPIRACA